MASIHDASHTTYGFQPAVLDARTQVVYPCRYEDGRLAPFHIFDGLPDEVLPRRSAATPPEDDKPRLVCGFLMAGRFLTREEVVALPRG